MEVKQFLVIFTTFFFLNVESFSIDLNTDNGVLEDHSTIEIDQATVRMLVEKIGYLENAVSNLDNRNKELDIRNKELDDRNKDLYIRNKEIDNRNKELDTRNRELEHDLTNQRVMIADLQSSNQRQDKLLASLNTLLKQKNVEVDPYGDNELVNQDVEEEAPSVEIINTELLNGHSGLLFTDERSIRQREADGRVAFFATIPKTITNLGVNQIVEFGNVTTNVGNAMNPKTGVFTAPYPGTYVFSVSLMGSSHAGSHYFIAKNRGMVSRLYVHGTESPYTTTSHTVVLQLSQGDDVEIRNSDAGESVYGYMYSCFSGFLLYPGNNAGVVVG